MISVQAQVMLLWLVLCPLSIVLLVTTISVVVRGITLLIKRQLFKDVLTWFRDCDPFVLAGIWLASALAIGILMLE